MEAEGTVRKTDLEDQRQGLTQETKKTKKEVTIDAANSTTPTVVTETCTSTTKMSPKPDFLMKISLLGSKVAAIFQKFWHVLSNILIRIFWVFIAILLIMRFLFTIYIIFWSWYALVLYVFGLDNILTITCWVPIVVLLVIGGFMTTLMILTIVVEWLGDICSAAFK